MDEFEKQAPKAVKLVRLQAWIKGSADKSLRGLGYRLLRETATYICYETKDGNTRIIITKARLNPGDKNIAAKRVWHRNDHGGEETCAMTWEEIIAVAEILKELTEKELSADVADNE